jgi:hypothetical protein
MNVYHILFLLVSYYSFYSLTLPGELPIYIQIMILMNISIWTVIITFSFTRLILSI